MEITLKTIRNTHTHTHTHTHTQKKKIESEVREKSTIKVTRLAYSNPVDMVIFHYVIVNTHQNKKSNSLRSSQRR